MSKKAKWILRAALGAVLIAAIVCLAVFEWQEHNARKAYEEAEALAAQPTVQPTATPEPTAAPTAEPGARPTPKPTPDPDWQIYSKPDSKAEELLAVNIGALKVENEDVVGWICIPDTVINYPIVQGTDNEFYLENTWQKEPKFAGAIFMECGNSPDLSDFNTIVYGHNMRSESMFGSLKRYKRAAYWQAHPSVYIVTEKGVYRYDIFAARKTGVETIVYGTDIETVPRKQEFLLYSVNYSMLDTGIEPTTEDRILTLSTCSGNGHEERWVVQGVLTGFYGRIR